MEKIKQFVDTRSSSVRPVLNPRQIEKHVNYYLARLLNIFKDRTSSDVPVFLATGSKTSFEADLDAYKDEFNLKTMLLQSNQKKDILQGVLLKLPDKAGEQVSKKINHAKSFINEMIEDMGDNNSFIFRKPEILSPVVNFDREKAKFLLGNLDPFDVINGNKIEDRVKQAFETAKDTSEQIIEAFQVGILDDIECMDLYSGKSYIEAIKKPIDEFLATAPPIITLANPNTADAQISRQGLREISEFLSNLVSNKGKEIERHEQIQRLERCIESGGRRAMLEKLYSRK